MEHSRPGIDYCDGLDDDGVHLAYGEHDLGDLGFDTDLQLHLGTLERVNVQQLARMFFEATYTEPCVVLLKEADDLYLRVVMTMVRQIFEAAPDSRDLPVSCYEHPDFYFEGWIVKSMLDPFPDRIAVRGFIPRAVDRAYVQHIPERSERPITSEDHRRWWQIQMG